MLASRTIGVDIEIVNLTDTLNGSVISCCVSQNFALFLIKTPNPPHFTIKRVLFAFSRRFCTETIDTSAVNWAEKDEFCKISCGRTHFSLLVSGSVYTWGSNLFAALGHNESYDDNDRNYPKPLKIQFFDGLFVEDVQCGYWHTVVKTKFGF